MCYNSESNIIVRLEFEVAYHYVKVQYVSHEDFIWCVCGGGLLIAQYERIDAQKYASILNCQMVMTLVMVMTLFPGGAVLFQDGVPIHTA